MSNIIVRQAQIEDAEGIAKVHVLSWKKTYSGLIPQQMLDDLDINKSKERWEKSFNENNPDITVIVAIKNSKVVGWASYGKNRDEDVTKDTGEIRGIYAHPEYLGIGVGSKMMDYALEKLKEQGYKKASLWVLTTNQNARNWYGKKGWRNEGKIKLDKRGDHELHETRYIKDLSS